jgi:hypothetical protein
MTRRKFNFRKISRWALAMASIFIVILLAWRFISTRGYESAAGIYITTGGQSFLEIKKGRFGSLHVKDGLFYSFYWYLPNFSPKMAGEGPVSLKASYRNGRLFLTQSVSKKGVYGREYYRDRLKLALAPSKTKPGDWDLLDASLVVFSGQQVKLISKDFWKQLRNCRGFSESAKYVKTTLFGNESMYCYLEPSNAPVKSFLHHIDDERIPFLYHSLFEGDYTSDTLSLARDISGKFSGKSYLDLLLVDMESLANHADRSLELYREWMKRYGNNPDPLSELVRGIVWRNVSNAQWKKRNGRIEFKYNDIFETGKTPEERNGEIRNLFHVTDFPFYPLAQPLVPAFDNPDYMPHEIPYFSTFLYNAKIARTLSAFYLFQGRFTDALEILATFYTLGQSLCSHGVFIPRILGIDICSVTSLGLEQFVLNACETPEDLKRTWIELEKFNNSPIRKNPGYLREGEYPILLCLMINTGKHVPYMEQILREFHSSDVKLQLLRMAAAVKYHLASSGDFPASPADFAPFLPQGPPEDDFCKGTPLRFRQFSEDELRIYSIGPDEKDDLAAFAYDPTNGGWSSGDVYIRIPRDREYPYPIEGVHASNAYELLNQFPNGLTQDPFADTKYRPLSIIESRKDQPLIVFSFGPDMDEDDFTPLAGYSFGGKKGDLAPVPTPEPPPNASFMRSLQWVMRRSEETPSPPGYWTLEPMYDPTNGATSNGDVFIEIPRR